MGACYSVALNLTIADEKACVETLCNKIKNDSEKVNYNLELAEKLGLSTDNLADLICIFFGGCNLSSRPHLFEDNRIEYYSDFDASYGWGSVMYDAFTLIAPFLKNGSKISVYPDESYWNLIVENGKCK